MARYKLDMTKPHKVSMLELVNHDNAATIGTALTIENTNLISPREVQESESIARTHAVTLQNKAIEKDTVEVFYNKINLNDVVTMTQEGGDFNWYDPDTWDDSTSPAKAIEAFKAAATKAGVDASVAMDNITVTRALNEVENHYYLTFSYESMVFITGAKFKMPKHLSEVITVTDLNGFIYEPLQPAAK